MQRMPKETMTPRERWLAVLSRETPDRVPMDYWATGEVNDSLMKHLGCDGLEDLYERLHIDRPVYVGPTYVGPPTTLGEDTFGCRYEFADYGSGKYLECTHHPLAEFQTLGEIERSYDRWPSADWYDYSVIPDQIRGKETRPIQGGGSEPFLTYTLLRGQQQLEHRPFALCGRIVVGAESIGEGVDLLARARFRAIEEQMLQIMRGPAGPLGLECGAGGHEDRAREHWNGPLRDQQQAGSAGQLFGPGSGIQAGQLRPRRLGEERKGAGSEDEDECEDTGECCSCPSGTAI